MRRIGVALFGLLVGACGGDGGSSPAPTTPAPIPAVDTCNSIGGTASTTGGAILNGSGCPADRSSENPAPVPTRTVGVFSSLRGRC